MPTKILIIDDEKSFVRSLIFALEEADVEVRSAHTGEAGLKAVRAEPPDIVLLDLRLPGLSGMDVLAELCDDYPSLPVVMISAHGDTRAAVQAIKTGASDYLTKPFAIDELLQIINNTVQPAQAGAVDGKRQVFAAGLVGDSEAMTSLWQTVGRVARSSAARILLQGESGTGKTLVASAIHRESSRSGGAFVDINCAALPEHLIEAELFGAEKGAYTGAHQKRLGLVAMADGGTLFLDEIGELPLALQAKLLHFLEDGSYRPVGALQACRADVRVVAATNRSLDLEVREGRFREDLYFRLNVIELTIPPLRERGADVRELVATFAQTQAAQEGCAPIQFAPTTTALLEGYAWPGNIRELKNLVERLTILHPGQVIEPDQLPGELHCHSSDAPSQSSSHSLSQSNALNERLQKTEREIVLEALAGSGGHKGRAAEFLGLSRHAFKRRLQRLGLVS